MKNFIVYSQDGIILRTGKCSDDVFLIQARFDEFVMEGTANDVTQKVEFDGYDNKNQPSNPRVVDKTPAEIEAEKLPEPPATPFEKQTAHITNEQLQDVLNRLAVLEAK